MKKHSKKIIAYCFLLISFVGYTQNSKVSGTQETRIGKIIDENNNGIMVRGVQEQTGRITNDGIVRMRLQTFSEVLTIGSIDKKGIVRDAHGNIVGSIDEKGIQRDADENPVGSIDEKGIIRDTHGNHIARIDDEGNVFNRSSNMNLNVGKMTLSDAVFFYFFTLQERPKREEKARQEREQEEIAKRESEEKLQRERDMDRILNLQTRPDYGIKYCIQTIYNKLNTSSIYFQGFLRNEIGLSEHGEPNYNLKNGVGTIRTTYINSIIRGNVDYNAYKVNVQYSVFPIDDVFFVEKLDIWGNWESVAKIFILYYPASLNVEYLKNSKTEVTSYYIGDRASFTSEMVNGRLIGRIKVRCRAERNRKTFIAEYELKKQEFYQKNNDSKLE
jgi:hypothetical protein